MSFTTIEQATPRMHRSELTVPGSTPGLFEKASHAAQGRIPAACRAYGLGPIDGPYGDFKDPDGYVASARRAAAIGFEGKWAIHPSQIELANQVFSPSQEELDKAQGIVDAMTKAARDGKGAVQLDGRLIDIVSIRMAQNLLAKAEAIAASGKQAIQPPRSPR